MVSSIRQHGLASSSSSSSRERGSNQLISPKRSQQYSVRTHSTSNSKNEASPFIREHLRQLSAYTPIEPFEIISAKLGRRPEDIVKLDANENPYGPPPEVLAALGSMKFPNIYPDPESRTLRKSLSEWIDVPAENILVGCGADELIDLLMRCVLEPGDTIVDCPPTFTMYKFDAAVNAAGVVTVPRLDGFRIDVQGIKKAVEEHKPKIVFLTSPNNPDGGMISEEELIEILNLPVLVVLDEAYIEFSEEQSRMAWVQSRNNLVVLRTFSKCAALAGLRVGYGAFPLDMIEYLWRAKQPYNVSVAAEVAAVAALSNLTYMHTVRDALVQERERLFKELQSVSYLEPYPSSSNFILCKVLNRSALDLKKTLAEDHGVMIRHYSTKELDDYVRISVGTTEQTDILVKALSES